jgi:hypothetical protein
MTVAEAPFVFHHEYLEILFNLNILENKREDFIESTLV